VSGVKKCDFVAVSMSPPTFCSLHCERCGGVLRAPWGTRNMSSKITGECWTCRALTESVEDMILDACIAATHAPDHGTDRATATGRPDTAGGGAGWHVAGSKAAKGMNARDQGGDALQGNVGTNWRKWIDAAGMVLYNTRTRAGESTHE